MCICPSFWVDEIIGDLKYYRSCTNMTQEERDTKSKLQNLRASDNGKATMQVNIDNC